MSDQLGSPMRSLRCLAAPCGGFGKPRSGVSSGDGTGLLAFNGVADEPNLGPPPPSCLSGVASHPDLIAVQAGIEPDTMHPHLLPASTKRALGRKPGRLTFLRNKYSRVP